MKSIRPIAPNKTRYDKGPVKTHYKAHEYEVPGGFH